jgi:DNA-binding NarL/FixJ family response regulator
MTDPISVIIADDHPVFRDGLRASLVLLPDVEVVGEAATGTQVVDLVDDVHPDVIVMDVQMPEMNGIEATRRIVQKNEHVRILVLSMAEDDDSVFAAMRAGARGYLLKGSDKDDIVRAIRSVASGDAVFGPALADRISHFFSSRAGSVAREAFPRLTDRESEVLQLVAQGANNAQIARRLTISQKTVRNHVSNILVKLQAADRSEAIVRARQVGLGSPEPPSPSGTTFPAP